MLGNDYNFVGKSTVFQFSPSLSQLSNNFDQTFTLENISNQSMEDAFYVSPTLIGCVYARYLTLLRLDKINETVRYAIGYPKKLYWSNGFLLAFSRSSAILYDFNLLNDYDFCGCVFTFDEKGKNKKFSAKNFTNQVERTIGSRFYHRSQIFHKTENETFHCILSNPASKCHKKPLHPLAAVLNQCFHKYPIEWTLHLTPTKPRQDALLSPFAVMGKYHMIKGPFIIVKEHKTKNGNWRFTSVTVSQLENIVANL